jgi:hypothetical protein
LYIVFIGFLLNISIKNISNLQKCKKRRKEWKVLKEGSQYTSQFYRNALQKYDIQQSMNSAGRRCPNLGVPAKSQTLWGKDEQGSEHSFRRKAETELSGLCDDARTTPGAGWDSINLLTAAVPFNEKSR